MAETGPLLGHTLDLTIGPPAHGGSCVARHEGRAVFVRHTLPGERVRALVTEDRGGAYCFADAVEIIDPSPDRVVPPCRFAGPGACGGCDWQHVDGAAQRELKAEVVRDQFTRLAHLDVSGLLAGVEELPGGLLGWRTRNVYAVDRSGTPGLRRHRSHEVLPVDACLLGAEHVGDAAALSEAAALAGASPGLTGIELARGDGDEITVLGHRPGPGRQARGRRPPDRVSVLAGPSTLHHGVLGRDFDVDAAGFWQVHPAAAETFAGALIGAVAPRPGETVIDLYAGAGALTAALAGAVTATGHVVSLESHPAAVADAQRNLADLPWVEVQRGRVDPSAIDALGVRPDVIVLDPPRAGAGRAVVEALLAQRPRVVGYVACDPAALARDVATAVSHGWRLRALRAFDAFPMTHHVECVATLEPTG